MDLQVIIYLHIKLLQGGFNLSQQASHSILIPGVQQSWLPGHHLDLSDPQWREFRGSLGTLAAALTAFAVCSRLVGAPSSGATCTATTGESLGLLPQAIQASDML